MSQPDTVVEAAKAAAQAAIGPVREAVINIMAEERSPEGRRVCRTVLALIDAAGAGVDYVSPPALVDTATGNLESRFALGDIGGPTSVVMLYFGGRWYRAEGSARLVAHLMAIPIGTRITAQYRAEGHTRTITCMVHPALPVEDIESPVASRDVPDPTKEGV